MRRISHRLRIAARLEIRSALPSLVRVFALLVLSLFCISLSCQHLHHCGLRFLPYPYPPWENERLERSIAFLKNYVAPKESKGLADFCFAMVTLERPKRYVLSSVASLLYHSGGRANIELFVDQHEQNRDAELIFNWSGVPLKRVPPNGTCKVPASTFYARKAHVFAYAIQECQKSVHADGWVVLMEDDVISTVNVLSQLSRLLFNASDASMVKLFSPDAYEGWSYDNVSDQFRLTLLGALIMSLFHRKRRGIILVFLVSSLCCFLWIRMIPRQLWSVLLPRMSLPHLRNGALGHASQAVAVPRRRSESLSQRLCHCASLTGLKENQDLLFHAWASRTGPLRTSVPSLFQHIGWSTSVKGRHQGWRLSDAAFGDEIFPVPGKLGGRSLVDHLPRRASNATVL